MATRSAPEPVRGSRWTAFPGNVSGCETARGSVVGLPALPALSGVGLPVLYHTHAEQGGSDNRLDGALFDGLAFLPGHMNLLGTGE